MYSTSEQRSLVDLSKKYLTEDVFDNQISDLRKILVFHEWKYSIQNDPVISDFEYDSLYRKLEVLEGNNPSLITSDSPTQRVSNELTEDLPSVEHLVPMLSLGNSYNADDLNDFDTQIKKLVNLPEDVDIEYVVEPKFDGGSIALVYENNQFIRGATRGNGTMGEEMTANARTMPSVPLRANFEKYNIKKVELRGEVVIRKDLFEKMNKKRAVEGLTLFANPRNTASGGLRVKDPKDAAKRNLVAFVYQIGVALDTEGNNVLKNQTTHNESIELLGSLGFKIPTIEKKVCRNIQEAIDFCIGWEAKREGYDYEIDGMVVKVNSLELQDKCGFTNHHPRWAIAFKFKAKQASTKLIDVEYQIGKIGSVTPVAKLEPVALAGVTISSVSLHNADFISSKDLRLGDTVLVERAGDVIPYIVKPMDDLRDGSEHKIIFPTHCPSCNNILTRAKNEAAWRCDNVTACQAQVVQRMIFHVSKDAMDIDGFGKSYVERFYEEGWLKDFGDIYNLDYEKISELEGFGERSASKLKLAIEKAKKNPIHRVLHSLSIHHLGKKVSKLLAAEIKKVQDLQNWTEENFTEIKDIGPKVADNVIAFFSKEENITLLNKMESFGVNMFQTENDIPKAIVADALLSGKTILFTGTLTQMGRKEAQRRAEELGAKNISAVSSNLNILVAGEKAGSKLKKATALGTVEILTEQDFIDLLSS